MSVLFLSDLKDEDTATVVSERSSEIATVFRANKDKLPKSAVSLLAMLVIVIGECKGRDQDKDEFDKVINELWDWEYEKEVLGN